MSGGAGRGLSDDPDMDDPDGDYLAGYDLGAHTVVTALAERDVARTADETSERHAVRVLTEQFGAERIGEVG